ncbi:MAG: DUF2971 domain-containing protein [Rudaea sp.]|uniref:DUF2971 domain-containing protein n=1 Tax=unclassified Rudaea TaxID=2627037 RepID=UPI0010F85E71|nr:MULTISPECIES: DUF2971 domain-containing protein [unclassified Rudaea]MBN8884484.1 DUF2971 domain-containing protein [Rudaea sp.]
MDSFLGLNASWDKPGVPPWKKRRYWRREYKEPGPRLIYKFRALPPLADIDRWNVLRALLVDGEIWMAAPATFTDPMDSHIHFEFTSTDAVARRQELEKYLRKAGNLNSTQFRKWVVASKVDITGMVADPAKLDAFFERVVKLHKEVSGVCSFCETVRQLSVWDGYADGHRGIALQFEPSRNPAAFLGYSVRYSDDPPVIRDWMTKRDTLKLLETLLRKSTDYDHEREYRVFDPQRANYGRPYRPEALRAVIFGMRCDDAQRNQMLALLDEREKRTGLRPKLYQAHMDPRSGRLRFKRYAR